MTQATSILISELLQSANQAYDSYLSKAEHALQKHGERQGSVFPKVFGNPNAINMQAYNIDYLNEISKVLPIISSMIR